MNQDEIAVIIPCYNEALTIGKVVDDFHREMPLRTPLCLPMRVGM